jgi:hypothetical protein
MEGTIFFFLAAAASFAFDCTCKHANSYFLIFYQKNRTKDPDSSQLSASSGGMTSVFSSFMHQEGSDDEA